MTHMWRQQQEYYTNSCKIQRMQSFCVSLFYHDHVLKKYKTTFQNEQFFFLQYRNGPIFSSSAKILLFYVLIDSFPFCDNWKILTFIDLSVIIKMKMTSIFYY